VSTIVEEFKDKDSRNERLTELRARGHRPIKSTTTVPVKWEERWLLSYSPEQRKRRKKA
jgi:hypothetical protein